MYVLVSYVLMNLILKTRMFQPSNIIPRSFSLLKAVDLHHNRLYIYYVDEFEIQNTILN